MTESLDKAVEEKRVIAFLDLANFDDGAVTRGGCLVTDAMTRRSNSGSVVESTRTAFKRCCMGIRCTNTYVPT